MGEVDRSKGALNGRIGNYPKVADMNRSTACRWLSRLIRLGLGMLLLWTGIPKIVAPAQFLSSIYNYELVSPPMAGVGAVVLPWVEFLAGVCLLGGVCVPGALIACMGLFAVFTFAHASILHQGLSIDCGCGVLPGDGHVTYLTLARSLFLLLCAGTAYWCARVYQKDAAARVVVQPPEAGAIPA